MRTTTKTKTLGSRFGALLAALTMLLAAASGAAQAETLELRFQSEHPNVVEFALYSQHRQGHSWPAPGRVYVLDDYEVNSVRLSCAAGESICYGAWVKNRRDIYWGVGYGNRNRCRNCCYSCDGGRTGVITLTP